MSVVDDLLALEQNLRQKAQELSTAADVVAKAVLDLQMLDDALDAAADVVVAD